MSDFNQKDQTQTSPELPVLALRNLILFPGTVLPVEVGRKSSLRLLDDVVKARPPRLLVATQIDPQVEDPDGKDLHPLAVEAELIKLIRVSSDRVTAVLKGIGRRHMEVLYTEPYLVARALPVREIDTNPVQSTALMLAVRESAQKLGELIPKLGRDVVPALEEVRAPGLLADIIAAQIDMPQTDQLGLLLMLDVHTRLNGVLTQVQRRIEVIKLKERIDGQVREEMSRQQREAVLRQSMKAIQEELGEGQGEEDLDQFDERVAKAGMSEEAEKSARRQLSRLKAMPSGSPEYTVQRTYLEWLCDLPWSKRTEDHLELAAAREIFDADHHGLQKVKKRMLEYLAVRKLAPNKKGPILCLAGPPGVGKTSLGRSVARALGREFVRMSLGGVRDEAEIRGHRRTYIGALPGRIIQAMKRAGTKNPVLLLDEIDKLGADHRGDPSSALLEVLDPEQNNTFSDHYLEVAFDLSEVIFIGTANTLDTIPAALRDRMEVIELPGYTTNEKREIAQRHLIGKQITEHGLTSEHIRFSDEAVTEVIEHYTREAGVRNLERELASVIRGAAMKVAAVEHLPPVIEKENIAEYLGPEKFIADIAEQTEQPGVATGLAWTPVGGDILFIEVSEMPGKGQLHLTGQLGSVMKESAQAAMSWVRAHGKQLGLQPTYFENIDVHVHVPQGGVSKDGPSAGVAILSAMVSRFTQQRVRPDVAMTGEISLRGAVLPVGGIKEKILAAHRAGIKRVILPERNAKDLIEVPDEIKQSMDFVFVRHVDKALDEVIDRPAVKDTIEVGAQPGLLLGQDAPALPFAEAPVHRGVLMPG